MSRTPLPAGRDLATTELRSLATWLGDRPELWRPHVHHDPARRTFRRLAADDRVTVWLICWMPGHTTPAFTTTTGPPAPSPSSKAKSPKSGCDC